MFAGKQEYTKAMRGFDLILVVIVVRLWGCVNNSMSICRRLAALGCGNDSMILCKAFEVRHSLLLFLKF